MREVLGYSRAALLLTADMRRSGCAYLAAAGCPAAFDIGHEGIIRALARMPVALLSDKALAALSPTGKGDAS